MMGATLAIVPTYNEIDNVESIIRAVLELSIPVEVLIVDDNSPDGTGTRVKTLQAQYPGRLHLLERPGKQGLGTAYLAGFHWAVAREYSFVCELDADFSHNPKDIPRLVEACETGADVAVGSRYVTGVNVVNWPFSRIQRGPLGGNPDAIASPKENLANSGEFCEFPSANHNII